MLNRDYTSGIQNSIRNSLSLDFTPTPNKFEQLPEVVSKGLENWDNAMRKKAYVDALQTGDQEKIDKALASYDADAYQNVLKDREKRQQELDDRAAQRDFQREMMDAQLKNSFALENMRNQNARGLAEYKAWLNGGVTDTNAQRNVSAMIEAGYSPQEAWAMYYGGNNPTLNMDMLGQKGQEAYDKATGEALAKQQEQQRLAEQNDARLKAVQESLQNNPDTVGFYSPLKTGVARALGGAGDKDYLANRGYNMRALGEVQNALIAEAKASGQSGINTASEIQQATKGLNENSSFEEINGALQAMQDSIQRLRNSQKPSLMQYNQTPSDEDAWGGI